MADNSSGEETRALPFRHHSTQLNNVESEDTTIAASDSDGPPTLPSLATEIIEMIADQLMTCNKCCRCQRVPGHADRLFNLRLVCRELTAKTRNSFGRAAFNTIHTNLTFESLTRVETISGDPFFSKCVEALEIFRPCTNRGSIEAAEDHLKILANNSGIMYSCCEKDTEMFARSIRKQKEKDKTNKKPTKAMLRSRLARLREVESDHRFMQRAGQDGIMLASVLKKLVNLEDILFVSGRWAIDPTTIPYYSTRYDGTFTRGLSMIFAALQSGQGHITRFICHGHPFEEPRAEGASVDVLNVPPSHMKAFECMQSINLYLTARLTEERSCRDPKLEFPEVPLFFNHTQSLFKLNLRFDQWTNTDKFMDALSRTNPWPNLSSIVLGKIKVKQDALITMIRKNKFKLRCLRIFSAQILDGDLSGIYDALKRCPRFNFLTLSRISANGDRAVNFGGETSLMFEVQMGFGKYECGHDRSDGAPVSLEELEARTMVTPLSRFEFEDEEPHEEHEMEADEMLTAHPYLQYLLQ